MEKTSQGNTQATEFIASVSLSKAVGWGLIGGMVGTMVMDLILMGALSAVGLPAFTCFSIVGDTVARLFSLLSIDVAGGVAMGVATHYLVGPVLGGIFGVAISKISAFHAETVKKSILLAVLYAEILSQPILATTPVMLKMSSAETLQWFGGSFVMHFIFGVVLGVVVGCGLRLPVLRRHESSLRNPGLNYSPRARKT